ncbi:RNA polymerase sigma factor [Jatrophihabitans endophyticus]|uniref:RNA polymerase sigma factor n=1 Tax=Jatrophihabitans endophyticus TaxID=1206085 RepID=UPI001A0DE67B|nr:sigma-70 family RNA polymerase sigma factor [Jatrophihabitans endophyticus]MBE7186929.1 sigma-70 family RNA polymerase sigma factor [Jatrophihabitans endophyticus]
MTVEATEPGEVQPRPLEPGGFDAWVGPHLPLLRVLAAREVGAGDADDVVQDALVRAWRRRETFDASKGSARAWLIAILLDQTRRRRTRQRLWPVRREVEQSVPAADGSRLDLEALVRALPRRQREVVTLFYLADLPVDEVAAVLGIATGSVKAHLASARETLRHTWEQE